MSLRILPAILAWPLSVAFVLLPVNAQQAQSRSPQSLRLYVLVCGIITLPNVDSTVSSRNEVADMRWSHLPS